MFEVWRKLGHIAEAIRTRPMTIFLHIGAPKTGTTSIQHTMFRNADRLRRDHSINYSSVSLNHWAIVLPYVKESEFKPLENHRLRGLGSKEHFFAMAKRYGRELERDATRYKTHVLSSEQLLIADRDAIAGLKKLFDRCGLDSKIVVYVRHPAERVSSLLSQQLRGGHANLTSFQNRDTITPAVRRYAEIFGKENIVIRRFGERYFVNGDLIDDFTAVINQVPIRGLDPERLNESLSVPAVMVAESLFELAPLASGMRGREEYLTRIAGPKFRAPRATVKQAVEAHGEGLAYLESEFGIRFDEVDLSAFPETISWDFSPEAVASIAAILNQQSLQIMQLTAKLKRRRWDRRVKDTVRRLFGSA
jgi:hypothetical protein